MNDLTKASCEPCKGNVPPLDAEEIESLLAQLDGWQIITVSDIPRLAKMFRFANFARALAFTNRVGGLAEQQGHHPALTIEWGQVTVSWWTHKIKGLHRNDFVMAAKTEELVAE